MDYRKIEETKRIASVFYYNYGILKDVEGVKRYVGDKFIEHNPMLPDGPEALFRLVKFRHDNFPEARNEVKMTIADEDKVMFHVHSVLIPGERGQNMVETYRVENGKVVEHWSVSQNMELLRFPPLTDNGIFNPLGDGVLADIDKTEENRKIGTAFYEAYGLAHDTDELQKYLCDTYIQHNPHVLDGAEDFLRFVRWRRERYPQWQNKIKITVAQGNLVGFHVHSTMFPDDPGRNLVDIYRIENGKVVEHWDTIENVEVTKFPPLHDNGLY